MGGRQIVTEQSQKALYGMTADIDQNEAAFAGGTANKDDEGEPVLEDLWTYFEQEGEFPIEENADLESTDNADFVDNAVVCSDDALSLYLRQMGEMPLLSQEEEVALAKKMERGRQAQEKLEAQSGLAQSELALTYEQIVDLKRQIEEGRQARQHFIEANTRLVVSEAKHYRGSGLSFLDLIQAGNVGLIRAVDRFDYRLGNKFSTYAVWWIRQAIRRTLTRQGHTIRLPAHLQQRLRKLRRTARRLEKRLTRRPTAEEIATALGMEDIRRIRRLLQIGQQTLSLNTLIEGENSESELVNFIEDEDSPSPSQQAQKNMMQEDIKALIDKVLSPRELEVLHRHFGLGSDEPETLQAVADDFGVSRERVRQIERRALRKLRHPSNRYKLREYLS